MAVAIHDPMRAHVDHADDEVVLLRDDHLPAARGEERIIGDLERLAGREVPGTRELPQQPSGRADLDQPVVVAVGDQHRARQDIGIRSRSEVGQRPTARGRASGDQLGRSGVGPAIVKCAFCATAGERDPRRNQSR